MSSCYSSPHRAPMQAHRAMPSGHVMILQYVTEVGRRSPGSWFGSARGSMLQCEFVSERAGNSAGVLCGLSCLLSQEKQARPWSDQGPGQTTPSSFSGRVKRPNRFETSNNNNSRKKLERAQASCQTHTCCFPSTQHSNLFPPAHSTRV